MQMLCKPRNKVLLVIGALFLASSPVVMAHNARACDWGLALKNITWVTDLDKKARYDFQYNINCNPIGKKVCMGPYEAVLKAQEHNHGAHDSIVACEAQARQYLRNRGYGG